MRSIASVALLNFKQGIREKLFFGVILFFISFLSFCVLLGKLSPGESEKVLRNASLAGIELSCLILVVFSLIFSFYKEKDSRMLEIYLSHFSRPHYLAGKLLGYLLLCAFYLLLAGLGSGAILFLYKSFLWQSMAALYSLFLKLSIVIAFSLAFSCLFSSAPVALMCSLFLYFASETAYQALQIISLGQSQAQIAFFKGLFYLLPNMHKIDIKSLAVYGKLPPLGFFLFISIYVFVYSAFLWWIAKFIFIRKEY